MNTVPDCHSAFLLCLFLTILPIITLLCSYKLNNNMYIPTTLVIYDWYIKLCIISIQDVRASGGEVKC